MDNFNEKYAFSKFSFPRFRVMSDSQMRALLVCIRTIQGTSYFYTYYYYVRIKYEYREDCERL